MSYADMAAEGIAEADAYLARIDEALLAHDPIRPFRGPMEMIVESITSAAPRYQPALAAMSALVSMASACGSRYWLPSGSRLNLYGLLVAPTGMGKDEPMSMAARVALMAGAEVLGTPGSGAGLEDLLIEGAGMLVHIDEIGHVLQAGAGAKAPPYLVHLNGVFLKLFSASSGTYRTRSLAKSAGAPARAIANPCLSLIGATTPEILGRAIGADQFADGLMGRMIFAMADGAAVQTRRTVPRLRQEFAQAAEAIKAVGAPSVPLSFAPGALEVADALMREFDIAGKEYEHTLAQSMEARAYEKLERIAGVLAVWDSPHDPQVTGEHLTWAADLIKRSNAAMLRFVLAHMHEDEVLKVAAKIRDTARRLLAGELKTQRTNEVLALRDGILGHSLLLRQTRISARTFKPAIDHLIEAGDVEVAEVAEAPEFRAYRFARGL